MSIQTAKLALKLLEECARNMSTTLEPDTWNNVRSSLRAKGLEGVREDLVYLGMMLMEYSENEDPAFDELGSLGVPVRAALMRSEGHIDDLDTSEWTEHDFLYHELLSCRGAALYHEHIVAAHESGSWPITRSELAGHKRGAKKYRRLLQDMA